MVKRKRLNQPEVSKLPHKPGAYMLFSKSGTVVYTGNTGDLRHRVSAHYQKDASRPAHERRRTNSAEAFKAIPTGTKTAAKKKEQELIKAFSPKFNLYRR